MSENKGVFGFFKKKAAAPTTTIIETVQETSLNRVDNIVPRIIPVLEEQLRVQVSIGSGNFSSYFEWELLEDGDGNPKRSKLYLEEGRFLLLAPLDPPIGNLKIRSAGEVRLEFSSRSHLLECVTSLEQITPSRKICLAFPKMVRQKPQRRSVIRALVDRTVEIQLSVVRPSGIVFEGIFRNVSTKGGAFYGTGATPNIADNSQVGMTIVYPEGKVEVDAVVMGSYHKEGEQMFRVLFLMTDQQLAQDISQVVSHVQRSNIQRRKKLLR